ncbi:MAG: PPC domain-containing protein [Planctomycetes bacterium]|nr:PPC domain-containing protein [Planctomycetota bacterium]
MKRISVALWALTITSLFAATTEAAIGFRQLTSVYPVAVQRGTTGTVKVRSNFTLDRAYQVFFDHPGLMMKLAETAPIDAPLKGRGTAGTPFKFTVEAPAEQTPGIYEVRIATPAAVSSVTHLLITDFPVVEEQTSPNEVTKTGQLVTLPAAVCGTVEKAEDVDFYRFEGKRGQRITFNVYGQRVTAAIHDMVGRGGYHLDPIITLYDPYGTVIGQNDNFFGGDALLVATLPADGIYALEMRDTRYSGDPRYTYCIEMAARPVGLATFPLAMQQGATTKGELLVAGSDETSPIELKAAKDAAPGFTERRFAIDKQEANPVRYLVSAERQITRDDKPTDKPLEVGLPVGISGRLAKPGETHQYSFDAKKGRYYRLNVTSKRLGLPLDSMLVVLDSAGKKISEADDQQYTSDAELTFAAPSDGRYTVQLKDVHDRGGPNFVYHLAIEQAGPEFQLQGRFYYAMLGSGVSMMWFAKVARLNGFDGPIEVHVDGLPAGVTYTPLTVPAGMNHGAMILSAAKDAQVGASLARVWGRAQVKDADGKPVDVVRPALITGELQGQGGGQGFWPINTSLVGVVEPLDLTEVVATPDAIQLPRGGKAEVKLRIARSKDYKDPVSLEWTLNYFTNRLGEQLPPGVTLAKGSQTRLAGNTLEAKIGLEAAKDALLVERLPIGVLAGVSISFSIDTLYSSNPIMLSVTEPSSAQPATKPVAKAEKKKK